MSNTISEKLEYLAQTKSLIREAIEKKGVNVPEDALFRDYAELIGSIVTHGIKVNSVCVSPESGEFTITFEDGKTVTGLTSFDENGLPTSLADDAGNSVEFSDGFPTSATRADGYTVTISGV